MKLRTTILSATTLLLFLSGTATAADDIYVIGKKLESALSAGDYYTIGLYYGQIKQREWEMQQARIAASAAAAAAAAKKREVEKCIGMADVNLSLCEKTAHNVNADAAISCNAPAMGGFITNALGMGSMVEACNSSRAAKLNSDLADCNFLSQVARQSCQL